MKNIVLVISFFFGLNTNAQFEASSFTSTGRGGATTFASDYQAVGINPANLGWNYKFEDKKVAFGMNEFTFSIHSEALSKQELRDDLKDIMKNGDVQEWTYDEKITAGKDFANSGLALNVDYGSVGFAVMTEKLGGIGFRINDRAQFYSRLGDEASDLMFLGKTSSLFDSLAYAIVDANGNIVDTAMIANNPENIDTADFENILSGVANIPLPFSRILDGSKISMSWTREYNLSYGRKLIGLDSTFMLFGGVGVKYVQGLALIDIESANGDLTAFSAVSPGLGIDFGAAAASNPSAIAQDPSKILPTPVGHGWGFDVGFNAVIKNKLKIGVAVTNIGSVTWDGNVYTVKDTLVFDTQSNGLDSYNVLNGVNELIGDDGLIEWEGLQERKVQLPTLLRAGASLVIGKKLELGVDFLLPTNEVPGSLEGVQFGFGGDFTPIKWVKLQAGFVTGGNYDFQMPVGITFIAGNGGWEGGVASRDAVSFFSQNTPTLSLSMGFMRFRF